MSDDFWNYDVDKTTPPEDDTDPRGRPTKLTDLDRELIAQAKEADHRDHTHCFAGPDGEMLCTQAVPETCVCYHPHGECVACGCRLLAKAAKERAA